MESLLEHLHDLLALTRLIGEAPSFLKALAMLPVVAKSEATVLISGETGTGKELVAHALHHLSSRAPFPFVPANCGRLPDTLLEDELFGHERGAFTDARAPRRGLIAQAERGTLFLDEVEALSPKAQVVLLRVLQDKKYRPLGSSQHQQADVRIVVATNAPLEQLVKEGSFRADLYYRLCVFSLNLPPLRDRREDILLLINHFLTKHAPVGRGSLQMNPSILEALMQYDWPGNVRELENAIIRAVHFCQTDQIELADLGIPFPPTTQNNSLTSALSETKFFGEMKKKAVEDFERDYLTLLMRKHNGNVSHAARTAGKERREIGKLLKKHQINPKDFFPLPPNTPTKRRQ